MKGRLPVTSCQLALIPLVVGLLAARMDAGENEFLLGEKETIVFAGDSITAAGHYVRYVEGYLRTRFPERTFRVVNAGRKSETLSGLSEPSHPGPRPTLFERFDRDVAAPQPTWVVACYGMNDGIYHPPSEERLGCFKVGAGQMISRIKTLPARALILTPPSFDPKGKGEVSLNPGETYSFRKPFPGYDGALGEFSEWLKTLRGPGLEVADLHLQFGSHLETRRQEDPAFALQRDGVHPNETGHLLMAMAVLEAWKAPALVAEAIVDASGPSVVAGDVKDVVARKDGLELTWTSKVPMPADERWDAASLTLERFTERFNRQRLTVRGLPAGRHEVRADGVPVGTFTAAQLAEGIDVTALDEFPTSVRSREVLAALGDGRPVASGPMDVKVAIRAVAPEGKQP